MSLGGDEEDRPSTSAAGAGDSSSSDEEAFHDAVEGAAAPPAAATPAGGAPAEPEPQPGPSSRDDLAQPARNPQMDSPSVPFGLVTSLEQCEYALNQFLDNNLQGAIATMQSESERSLYHSLAMAIFNFLPAILTLDPSQVEVALAAIKQTLALCQQYRRRYSFVESLGTMIRRPNGSAYTELEAHAELCYSEALLLQAALVLLDGEDLAGLVRATLKVKTAHTSYKKCERILENRRWEGGRSFRDFESGVRLGIASFNFLISLLPPRLVALLSYAGFTGDRAAGLAGLQQGSRGGGLRAPLCDLTLLAVQLVVLPFVAASPDLALAQCILRTRLQQFPDGAFFLLFLGRMQLLQGFTSQALATYTRVAAIPRLWPQLQHLTYWECMWACSIELRWREAANFAGRLLNESAWSRTVYAYARAAFLLQLPDPTPAEIEDVSQLLGRAASYRQRIAGKSLPMEKFVIRRCQQWAASKELTLPGLELLCLWNLFPALAVDKSRANAALQMINAALSSCRRQGPRRSQEKEALHLYLLGALQAAMRREKEAMKTLGRVVERSFSGYLLESRLQFRMESRLVMIQELPEEEEIAAADQEDFERQRRLEPEEEDPDDDF